MSTVLNLNAIVNLLFLFLLFPLNSAGKLESQRNLHSNDSVPKMSNTVELIGQQAKKLIVNQSGHQKQHSSAQQFARPHGSSRKLNAAIDGTANKKNLEDELETILDEINELKRKIAFEQREENKDRKVEKIYEEEMKGKNPLFYTLVRKNN